MLPKIAVEFISNKIADAVNKSNDDKIVKQETVEEIIIKQIEKSMIKLIQYKISELWNDSTVSKFVTKNWVNETIYQVTIFYQQKYKV